MMNWVQKWTAETPEIQNENRKTLELNKIDGIIVEMSTVMAQRSSEIIIAVDL